MRENYRKPIASKEKFPQFITMNVIDGQAGLARYSSLIFYSLTINNILNIIILVILAAVSIRAVTNMGIVGHAINGTQQYATKAKEENDIMDQTGKKIDDAVAKVKEIQNGGEKKEETRAPGIYEYGTTNLLISWDDLKDFEKEDKRENFETQNNVLIAFEIEGDAFLIEYEVKDETDAKYKNIDVILGEEFPRCGGFVSESTERVYLYIPDGVVLADESGFARPSSVCGLTGIHLPASMTEIWERAFLNCGELESITIPDTVTTIGENAFKGCEKLTEIKIPSSITMLGHNIIDGCTSLKDLTIGCSVIPECCFYGTKSIENLIISDGVSTIEDYAFEECTELKNVTISHSVTTMGNGVFGGCNNIEIINVRGYEGLPTTGWDNDWNAKEWDRDNMKYSGAKHSVKWNYTGK